MPNWRLLGLALAALLAPSPLLAQDAQTYLGWCHYNVRTGADDKAEKHCGLYRQAALGEGLGVWSQSQIETAVAQGRRLDAADAPKLSTAQYTAAPSAAGDKADTYLGWFQNNVRGSNPGRADKHWQLYVTYAKRAGLALWSRSEVEAHARRTSRKLSAYDAGGSISVSKSEESTSGSSGAPRNWDEAWRDPRDLDGRSDNGESTPYVKDLIAKMGNALLGSGHRPGQAYLSRTYAAYNSPQWFSGRGKVYVRHTGTDFIKPAGSTVRALTSGLVVATYNDPRTSNQALAVVKEDGANRWWVYLHTAYSVRKGQRVAKGGVVGKVADPRGEWRNPHVHVNVMTTWPIGSTLSKHLSLGRSYHPDRSEAIRIAKAHTMHPLEAFARANNLLP